MWRQCVDSLLPDENRSERIILVDGTLGGGGHSLALLERLQPGDVLFGCDVDTAALQVASERLAQFTLGDPTRPLFVPVQSNFATLHTVLPDILHPISGKPILKRLQGVDGILLDLGVSSHQIDSAERGFAFLKDGPLDMRMSNTMAMTAADVCNEFSETDLTRILRNYGDEPRSKAIARSIAQRRPLSTTQHLVDAVAEVTPQFAKKGRRMGRTATCARVFQSLRIVVNQEDAVLQRALEEMCPALIRPGGRLAVLSYQSMEDRFVKRVMRDGCIQAKRPSSQDRDIYGNYVGAPKPWKPVGKRQKATQQEVALNPRARSATLRVAERLET